MKTKKENKSNPIGVRVRPSELKEIKERYGSLQKFVNEMIKEKIKLPS